MERNQVTDGMGVIHTAMLRTLIMNLFLLLKAKSNLVCQHLFISDTGPRDSENRRMAVSVASPCIFRSFRGSFLVWASNTAALQRPPIVLS